MTGYEAVNKIIGEVKKVIKGKDEVIHQVITAIIADGHILIDDIPGVGKTSLALAMSKAMSLEYNRMQFTPDVLPSDVTGFSMYNKKINDFEYKKGAVICNLFLADEINRTSSKTQSALLEAMEEKTVTVDANTYELPEVFNVIATQNPVGSIGTHMLPESQMDRFMFCVSMGYPSVEDEAKLLKEKFNGENDNNPVRCIIDAKGLSVIKNEVKKVYIHDEIYMYVSKLAAASRRLDSVELGISPRGSIAIMKAAQANAYIHGRDYVTPDDVNNVLIPATRHRIVISAKAKAEGKNIMSILNQIAREARK